MDADDAGRPRHLVLVVGTETDVGKTFVTAQLLQRLRACGVAVAASKPAQSYERGDGSTDAEILAVATGQEPTDVCPQSRWYEVPLAPPMAADVLGLDEIRLAALVGEITWPPDADVGCIEAVGGVRSPLAHDGDALDLAAAVDPDHVLVVAGSGLGVIGAVRLATAALDGRAVTVFLNRFDRTDAVHLRNRGWLAVTDGLQVVTSIDELLELHPDWITPS
jgi:dethiobiotin synthetase